MDHSFVDFSTPLSYDDKNIKSRVYHNTPYMEKGKD